MTVQRQETQTPSTKAGVPAQESDIVEAATATGAFNTLIQAMVAADLYDTLRGYGPFTVFAPTEQHKHRPLV